MDILRSIGQNSRGETLEVEKLESTWPWRTVRRVSHPIIWQHSRSLVQPHFTWLTDLCNGLHKARLKDCVHVFPRTYNNGKPQPSSSILEKPESETLSGRHRRFITDTDIISIMTKAWEREKSRMHELYMVRGMKLSQMQLVMREQHNFHASERAYKQKFKEWKWFKKTPRNTGISLEGMGVPVEPPLGTSRGFKIPHTSHHIPRHSSSSPVESIVHSGQMTSANGFGELSVGSDHSGFPDSQGSVLGLGSMQPIRSENYISLPPVSDLIPIEESVRESVRSAALLLESGKLEDAETFLEHATKTLQWLRGCR